MCIATTHAVISLASGARGGRDGRAWLLIENGPGIGTSRWSGKVEVKFLFRREADKFPVVDEPAAVAVAEVVEDDGAGGAEAGWHLEQLDKFLGGEAAGEGRGEHAGGGLECAFRVSGRLFS